MNPLMLLNMFMKGQFANHPLMRTVNQMMDASDILKDIAKTDSAISKACYYDSMRGGSDDRKY